jgi:hypothetical protein
MKRFHTCNIDHTSSSKLNTDCKVNLPGCNIIKLNKFKEIKFKLPVTMNYQENKTKIIIQVYNWQRIIATWCFRSKDKQRGMKKQSHRGKLFL